MKIGFEAKRAFKNFTGLGNYARSVIQILARQKPENQYFLYTPESPKNPRTNFLFELNNVFIKTAPIKWLKSYWRSRGVVKDLVKDGIELYHGLSHEIPSGLKAKNIKSVVTIHDLIYVRFPHYFKKIDRKIYDLKFRAACKNADQIIAISEQTKKDIIDFFNVSANKIEVVYQGCDAAFYSMVTAKKQAEVKQKYRLPVQYLVCVGTIEQRKNQLLILQALTKLDHAIKLVLVGKQTEYAAGLKSFIAENSLENRVIFLEGVSFEDLPAIYQMAEIFVYPSKFEGFGIPILEALNSGIPVIAAKGSCLEEAGGPDSIYIEQDDAQGLANAILAIQNNVDLKQNMIAKGKAFALNFREENIAVNLMKVYQKTLKNA